MTYKWDAQAADNYAKEFAAKICEENYVDVDALDGEQILEVTSVKQVNLLIIRLLYSRWQEENNRLQSPYFDFDNPEVQFALSEFMNILSQFIAVRQREFEPLLIEAVTNTLKLALQPKEYFSQLLRDLPNFRLSAKWVTANQNYFRTYRWVFDELQIISEKNPSKYANEVIEEVQKLLDKNAAEDATELLESFGEVLPLPIELYLEEEKVEDSIEKRSTGKSFFDSIVEDKLTERIRQKPRETPIQEPQSIQKQDDILPEVKTQPMVDNVINVEEETSNKVESVVNTVKSEELKRVNEQHVETTQSINDKAKTNSMVTDYHRMSRVDSIRKSISLNQRFSFTKYLFGDNVEDYNNSLDEIDKLQNYVDARSFVVHNYIPRFNWDVKSAEVDEFFEVLKRRFS